MVVLPGCAASSAAVGTAVVNTAIAASASAASRAQGGCYAVCSMGTKCNPETGYCDPIPCRDLCKADQQCDQTGPVEKCVPRSKTDLQLDLKPKEGERITPQ